MFHLARSLVSLVTSNDHRHTSFTSKTDQCLDVRSQMEECEEYIYESVKIGVGVDYSNSQILVPPKGAEGC